MSRESLNYNPDHRPPPASWKVQPSVVIDLFSVDEIVEEIWLSSCKDDATSVLEAYGHNLSEYQWNLLDEVLFGSAIVFHYQDEKLDYSIKLHKVLDRILF